MLSVVDGCGLAADPVLPSRDALLDAEQVASILLETVGVDGPIDLRGCVRVRAKYRIGESLRVVYRLDVGGRQQLVSARAFRSGGSAGVYERAKPVAVPAGALRQVWHDRPRDVVWWSFPNDRKLRGLSHLLPPRHELAGRLDMGEAADRVWRRSEVVEYAPERSVTLRASDEWDRPVAFAKVFAPGTVDVRALARRYDNIAAALLSSRAPVTAPRTLGQSAGDNLLLLQAMPGRHWSQLDRPELPPSLHALGVAIATLHSVAATPLGMPRFARLDVRRIEHSAQLIAAARPDVAALVRGVAERLCSDPAVLEAPVLLHGDCHPKNALLDDGRVALIDFDQAGSGAAAADIGSLLARLRQGALLGELSADADALGAAFLDGYRSVRPLPAARSLQWHTAAALLAERAMRAVNRVNVAALGRLDELLFAADSILRTGVSR